MREFSAEACVPAGHPCLPGHFPGQPLVPAVLLLDLVAEALRAQLGTLRISAIRQAKFLAPVRPGERLLLHFAVDEARGLARFRCECGGVIAAQGELAYTRT